MKPLSFRVCFLADTHLGFDLPVRPRVQRRRRGHDFFANYERVLAKAVRAGADLLVHGGDLFYRSRVPPELVQRAFLPLKRVAEQGIPVILVPGNHERSRIPHPALAEHPGIHIFHKPTTFALHLNGVRVALSGFPYCRDNVRGRMPQLLDETGWAAVEADVRLLCVHHCFEGATVGPSDYVFTTAPDVIRHASVPEDFSCVLTGHVHRHQVLTADLSGKPLRSHVLYPGSVERTSFAESSEPKGYLDITFRTAENGAGWKPDWNFQPLPARPMVTHEVVVDQLDEHALGRTLDRAIAAAPEDAVLRFRLRGQPTPATQGVFGAARFRSRIPPDMNAEVVWVDVRRKGRAGAGRDPGS